MLLTVLTTMLMLTTVLLTVVLTVLTTVLLLCRPSSRISCRLWHIQQLQFPAHSLHSTSSLPLSTVLWLYVWHLHQVNGSL